MTINEAMLAVAEEIAREYGYILIDESIILGKNHWFWGNKRHYPGVQVKSRTYILPVWEEEHDIPNYIGCKIYIDMYWGTPRIDVTYPDGSCCCLSFNAENRVDAQAFGNVGLEKAVDLKNAILELVK